VIYTAAMIAGLIITVNVVYAAVKLLWIYMYRRKCTMVREYINRNGYEGVYYELFNKNKPVSVRLTIEKIRFLKVRGAVIMASDGKNMDRRYDNKLKYGVPCRILFKTKEEFEKITGRTGMKPCWRDNVVYTNYSYKDMKVCSVKVKDEYQIFVTDGVNNYFTLHLTDTDIAELYSMHTRMDFVDQYETSQFLVKLYCNESECNNVKQVIDRKIKLDKLI
jgi:hypothetical protein